MENFKPAKVFDADGDLSQRWFVFYYFKNPDTGKYERFREMISASFKTRSDRYAKGKELKDAMNKRLREGFNPFMDYYRAKHKPKSRTYNYAVICIFRCILTPPFRSKVTPPFR